MSSVSMSSVSMSGQHQPAEEPGVEDPKESRSTPPEATGLGGERLRDLATGSVIASANLAEQMFHLGIRSGARATESVAGSMLSALPGARLVQQMARGLDHAAGRAEAAAGERVNRSLALMKGAGGDLGLAATGQAATARLSWSELAADTAFGPFEALLGTSLTLGADSVRGTLSSRLGQLAVDTGLQRLRANGNGSHGLDARSTRDAFLAVATDTGTTTLRELVALAEAAARMSLNDTRKMRRTMEGGLEEMRRLVASAEMQHLLPTPVVSESVQARARWVVERAPQRFLAALEQDASGRPPGWGSILRATLSDADNLRVFVFVYPQVLILVGTDVGKLLLAGTITFPEMEAFLEGRRFNENPEVRRRRR
ncbi:MAG: hypothetical protein AAF560_06945 [Acidobacteriota bacterium]